MARNKHPEETVNRIVDVASRLFLEKGYNQTSIQDIVDHLGSLSKGAIYHHFKSKAEIWIAVADRMTADSEQLFEHILSRRDLNGLEKLKAIFRDSLFRSSQDNLISIAPTTSNPQLLLSILQNAVTVTAPRYLLPILEEGIRDGSIHAEYPAELAQLILLDFKVWINPMVFPSSAEECRRKLIVLAQALRGLGLDIIDDEIIERLCNLTASYYNRK